MSIETAETLKNPSAGPKPPPPKDVETPPRKARAIQTAKDAQDKRPATPFWLDASDPVEVVPQPTIPQQGQRLVFAVLMMNRVLGKQLHLGQVLINMMTIMTKTRVVMLMLMLMMLTMIMMMLMMMMMLIVMMMMMMMTMMMMMIMMMMMMMTMTMMQRSSTSIKTENKRNHATWLAVRSGARHLLASRMTIQSQRNRHEMEQSSLTSGM